MAAATNLLAPAWHTVPYNAPGYRPVPMFRAHAWALEAARHKGANFEIFSADRRDSVLAWFNPRFGTNLHGQQYLYDHQHQPGFYPANPPDETSHCLRSDGNSVYRTVARGHLPAYMLGIDAVDAGKTNDCSHLVAVLNELGILAVRPYPGGGEAHHFVIVRPFAHSAWAVLVKEASKHHSRAWVREIHRHGVR
jgi:hypothetical protein